MKVFSKGIGLLELMLSLAVIAVLLLMATRYYGITRTSQRVNAATSTLNAVYAASEQWKTSYGSLPAGKNLISGFVRAGFLPKSFSGATSNPWGGSISAHAGSNAEDLIVSLGNVPINACHQLRARFQQKYKKAVNVSACNGTKTQVTFFDKAR